MPTTRHRTPSSGPGGASAPIRRVGRCGPGSTRSRPTAASPCSSAEGAASCRRSRPGSSPIQAPGWTGPRLWVPRATLLLRELLGFSAREAAEQLEISLPAVNSALQRGRRKLEVLAPDSSQQEAKHALGDHRLRALADGYAKAWEAGDVEAILAMLTEDAKYAMPPLAEWYDGRDGIHPFLTEVAEPGRWRFLPAQANGQIAFGTYERNRQSGVFEAMAVDVIALRGAGSQRWSRSWAQALSDLSACR